MPRITLTVEALKVESFATAAAKLPPARPTTTWMNTNEPGCTLPEICGDTPVA